MYNTLSSSSGHAFPHFPFTPSTTHNLNSQPLTLSISMATACKLTTTTPPPLFSASPRIHPRLLSCLPLARHASRRIVCKATEVSKVEEGQPAAVESKDDGKNWVPVVPLAALPKGERRVIIQGGETILLLWYKDKVVAIENRSPAEGAYTEGLLNAKLTPDGSIVCPSTDSTFDLETGEIKEWYPKNPVLRVLTPPLRKLFVYPVKTDAENIYISIGGGSQIADSTEIVFSGKAQPGVTATDVNVEEVRMVVDEDFQGFGFTDKNELLNGKAAIIGFLLLIDFELLTGKGLLKGTGFLDFIYATARAFGSSS